MGLRRKLGAMTVVLALVPGSAMAAQSATTAANANHVGVPPRASEVPEPDVRQVDLTGTCEDIGVGLVYVKLTCGNIKKSECGTRIGPVRSAAAVVSREVVRLDIKAENLPYSMSSDNLNSAAFRSCANGTPVKVKQIELWNNFTISGVQLESCTVSVSGGTQDGYPLVIAGVACTIKTREDTMTDSRPASCADCAQLNADVYHYYARWSAGVMTRYLHEAQAQFTGYDDRGTMRVSSVVDFGV